MTAETVLPAMTAPLTAAQTVDGSRVAPRSALVSLSAGVVGLASYACTLILAAPDDRTALIAPEQGIRITYGGLRKQVQDVAAALAAAGVKRGDRIGMALPNGIPNVVTFLAAAMAGTAAPLNPADAKPSSTAF